MLDGVQAGAVVLSLTETAKANNLNIYQCLYTLLLYRPDLRGTRRYKTAAAVGGIKERRSGVTNTEREGLETRRNLPV